MQPQIIMAANWKMNMTNSEAVVFARGLRQKLEGKTGGVKVVICAPFTALESLVHEFKGSGIGVGAQNLYFEEKGTFTGEISARMLVDIGVEYVIVGHSERRAKFGETDEFVNKKTKAALGSGLIPIVCVGESLEQRQQGLTKNIITTQLKTAFDGLSAAEAAKCVVAYEPVWAISKGVVLSGEKSLVATSEIANEACGIIRDLLAEMYGADSADAITIQYGGSMSSENSKELLAQTHINGGLIGGASLKVDVFAATVINVV